MAAIRREHLASLCVLLSLTLAAACTPTVGSRRLWPTERERALWNHVLIPRLAQPLWEDPDSAEAARRMMVPMHAAFAGGDPEWRSALHRHFGGYSSWLGSTSGPLGHDDIAYAYLASRYLVCASAAGETSLTPAGLAEILERRLVLGLAEADAAGSGTTGPLVPDDRLQAYGIAADLRLLADRESRRPAPQLDRLCDEAHTALDAEGWITPGGTWAYEVIPDVKVAALRPLVITSLADSEPAHSPLRERYAAMKAAMADLAFGSVFFPPERALPGLKARPLMTTAVGVRMDHLGLSPVAVGWAADFNYGLWAFLDDERAAAAYFDQAARFPLDDDVLEMYVAPVVPGTGRPAAPPREFFDSGHAEAATCMAARVATARSQADR